MTSYSHLGERRKQNRLKIASVLFLGKRRKIKENRIENGLMRVVFRKEKNKKKIENGLC